MYVQALAVIESVRSLCDMTARSTAGHRDGLSVLNQRGKSLGISICAQARRCRNFAAPSVAQVIQTSIIKYRRWPDTEHPMRTLRGLLSRLGTCHVIGK